MDAWARKSKARATAIFRESAQRLSEQVQTVQGEGGKLPIDTGFLRASFSLSLQGVPFGQGKNPGGSFTYDDSEVVLTLAGAELGQTIYGGWVAEYAPFMEERYGFLRSGAQNWQAIVKQVTAEAKARFP